MILQSHLDMVHQKNNDTVFDFESEGIRMRVQGDWIDAEGTTLGADNGIGVATIMATLSSNDIDHPALEAFFTIDEETGMTGAKEMDGSLLDGQILLNLDTEDDDELSIDVLEELIQIHHIVIKLNQLLIIAYVLKSR